MTERFQPCRVDVRSALVPARRGPGTGAAYRRPAGFDPGAWMSRLLLMGLLGALLSQVAVQPLSVAAPWGYQTFMPPSTTRSMPVTYELSSDARNSATFAMSSGSPSRVRCSARVAGPITG